MTVSKINLSERYGPRVAITCTLMVLAVLLIATSTGIAAPKPETVAEIALYQGPDRQEILIEGAKREGQLIFYTSNTWMGTLGKYFEKKYPFIKVSAWRTRAQTLLKRVIEEYAAGHFNVDVIEDNFGTAGVLYREGIFQEYYTPDASYYSDEVKAKGNTGHYYLGDREIYIGLAFNTKLIPPAEAPKSLKDLLDPKWKGKMSIAGSATGIRWIGNCLEELGYDYLEKLSHQDVKVMNISGAAIANLIVAEEVPLSPTIWNSNIVVAKRRGAPVEWRPQEPVIASLGYSGITTRAKHPHAAMLFLDYLHSKEGQEVIMRGGLSSPREDIGSLETGFKKNYITSKYPIEEYEKKFSKWESLLRRLFIRKR
ncbi:ABC transporter substrate-binding protein [Thermodesulfobacteriota bacterium]